MPSGLIGSNYSGWRPIGTISTSFIFTSISLGGGVLILGVLRPEVLFLGRDLRVIVCFSAVL